MTNYEFPPLEVLHQFLFPLRLTRYGNEGFRLTKRGAELATPPARLFAEVIPLFRSSDRPFILSLI